MNLEFERIPDWLRWSIPFLMWRRSPRDRSIYLTFDDGPTPGVTDQVLDMLARHQSKATFFMLGSMVDQFPELARRVAAEGHTIGNHGYAHLNGWKSGLRQYLKDAARARKTIEGTLAIRLRYFRPPFGRLGPLQGYCLWWRYKIAMWDVVAQDYCEDRKADDVYRIVQRHTRPGSIILMHDSELAKDRILEALPRLLQSFASQALQCKGL